MPHLPRLLTVCLLAGFPFSAAAEWHVISAEPGKRVEINRASIRKDENGKALAEGRIVLEKPINDPKTSSSYRTVQALSRYDCTSRSYSTIKRSYYKDDGSLLREEDVKMQIEMPVRTGMLDDKLLREACRPRPGPEAAVAARKTADKINQVAGDLRKANEALLQKELQRANLQTAAVAKVAPEERQAPPAKPVASPAADSPPRPATVVHRAAPAKPPGRPSLALAERARGEHARTAAQAAGQWAYEGEAGPDHWSRLKPEYALCANGKRQSPIDIRDGLRVDLEPIRFHYRPSQFRVIDNGHTVQVEVSGSSISVLGKTYELLAFHFHRPAEERVDGKSFDMVAHLVHKSEDGRTAVVAVLLDRGAENPLIQTIWNHLPLEKGEYVLPPETTIDLSQLLPEDRSYYTYMGSLTTPPCSEGVLWLVLKHARPISPEQVAIFARLYRHNARPLQPAFGRIIKESR